MRDHHQRAVDRLRTEYENDPHYPALIVGGSVAKGCARDDSDVDFLIVATPEEFDRRLKDRDLLIYRPELCDYTGGYVDGKIISEDFLHRLADHGNEPSRAAFRGAFLAYSHVPDLEQVVERIPVYPEEDRDRRIRTFYTMAFIHRWLMGEAVRHDNRYTRHRAASQLALYGGRVILAFNRVLFPYHKWFTHALEQAPHKPKEFIGHLEALLDRPGMETADAFFACVRDFQDWGVSDLDAYTLFMTDVEWSWIEEKSPIEDW